MAGEEGGERIDSMKGNFEGCCFERSSLELCNLSTRKGIILEMFLLGMIDAWVYWHYWQQDELFSNFRLILVAFIKKLKSVLARDPASIESRHPWLPMGTSVVSLVHLGICRLCV